MGEAGNDLVRRQIPQQHHAVVAGGEKAFAIGAESEVMNIGRVRWQLVHRLFLIHIPDPHSTFTGAGDDSSLRGPYQAQHMAIMGKGADVLTGQGLPETGGSVVAGRHTAGTIWTEHDFVDFVFVGRGLPQAFAGSPIPTPNNAVTTAANNHLAVGTKRRRHDARVVREDPFERVQFAPPGAQIGADDPFHAGLIGRRKVQGSGQPEQPAAHLALLAKGQPMIEGHREVQTTLSQTGLVRQSSCGVCAQGPGTEFGQGRKITRDEPHGYVFEVPASETGLVEPVPIKAMGRFEHEAAAVHEPSGIVYLTEDRHHSLFYRFIPETPGVLRNGGRLQALAIVDEPTMRTHNWSKNPDVEIGAVLKTRWIDLDNVNSGANDLRLRGATRGAATFARGEGLCVADDVLVFTCTIGGRDRLGQIFQYQPSSLEGQANEQDDPGRLTLIAESTSDSLLRNGDNLTMAPWGDLILCEDTFDHCGLVGIRPDGTQYAIANNSHSTSELAGVCFSPDGETMFVNIQYPGLTLAITGPWPS